MFQFPPYNITKKKSCQDFVKIKIIWVMKLFGNEMQKGTILNQIETFSKGRCKVEKRENYPIPATW